MTEAAQRIRERLGEVRPQVGVVLGSGLGGVADLLQERDEIVYSDLPGFRAASVGGHAGRLIFGSVGGTRVAIFSGRAHVYEGSTASEIATPIRTLKALGADTLILTCAAGSLRPDYGPGSLVAFSDHINLQGFNPLVGPNDEAIGPRFPSLAEVYDRDLRNRLGLPEGIYIAVSGPSFETPAEIRAFRTLGADLVGMSTVPEAIVAAHAGLRVAAIATVTNLAEGMGGPALSHDQTLAIAKRAAERLTELLQGFLATMAD